MYSIACSVPWTSNPDGFVQCTGTLTEQGNPALTLDDAIELKDAALVLFVVVFGILACKKALNL